MNRLVASLFAITILTSTARVTSAQHTLPTGVQQGLEFWQSDHGNHWDIVFNEITNKARMLLGGQAFLYLPASEAEEFQLARDFIDEAFGMFEVESSSLAGDRIITLPLAGFGTTDKRAVRFVQQVGGVPIVGRSVSVVFQAGTGKLLAIDSTAIDNLPIVGTTPLVFAGDAQTLATQYFELATGGTADEVGDAELVLLPTDLEETPLLLAWQVDVVGLDSDGADASFRYYVDAADGNIALADDRMLECAPQQQPTGKVRAAVTTNGSCCLPGNCCWPNDTGTNRVYAAQPRMTVTTATGQVLTTNASGLFTIPAGSSRTVTMGFAGPNVTVDTVVGTKVVVTTTLPSSPGSLTQITMNPTADENNVAQANAFYRINQMRDWVRGVNPNDAIADSSSDGAVVPYHAVVNGVATLPGKQCNAFYDGRKVKFFSSTPGHCGNSAFATVIWHEMGHWFNDRYGNGTPFSLAGGAFNEGAADVYSLYQMDYERLHFEGVTTRDGTNTEQICGDCVSQQGCQTNVHNGGLPLMGAFWTMRVDLKTASPTTGGALANALFLGWLNAFDQNEIHSIIEFQLLVLDDNDGNLANSTPHSSSIDPAFTAHGFVGFTPSAFTVGHNQTGVKICQ